jgi:P4 family phage/plasmid primase-like protien
MDSVSKIPDATAWLERRKAVMNGSPFVCMKCEREFVYPAERCEGCNRKTVRKKSEYMSWLASIAKDDIFLKETNPEAKWEKLCDEYEINHEKHKHDEAVNLLMGAANMKEGSNGAIIVVLSNETQRMERFVSFRDNGELFYYKNGIFIPNGEAVVDERCNELMKEARLSSRLTAHMLSEVKLKVKIDSYHDREEFDTKKEMICLENGVFNLETKVLVPHSPELKMLVRLPVIYDESKFPTLFDKYLREIVASENVPLMYEIIGYCLYRRYNYHKAFMFVGEGSNGKSVYIDTVKVFLGEDNCVNIPLQELEESRFAKGNLYRKLANLCADISPKALKGTGTFKMATGEDALTTDKKFKDMFTFTNYAKLIFSANRIPQTNDDTNAFFRRWIIVNFPNHFEGANDDKLLREKLKTQDELSGLFNVAVCGLKSILKNGKFTAEQSMDEAREMYVRLSDSVAAFVMDRIEIAGDQFETKKRLLEVYNEYCRDMKYPAVGEKTFYKRLNEQVRFEETQKRLETGIARVYVGIRLKSLKEEEKAINGQEIL